MLYAYTLSPSQEKGILKNISLSEEICLYLMKCQDVIY